MPGTIQTFFATIDPGSPPPQQPPGFCLPAKSISPANQSTEMRPLSSGLLRWRRRVLPPGLPAVRSEFQRHRLSTRKPYAGSVAKDRHWSVRDLGGLERAKGIEPSYAAWEAAVLPLNYARKLLISLYFLNLWDF
jgi:hypothetical protein